MSSSNKPQRKEYRDYDFRSFPFESLSLDIGKEIKPSKYNNLHIPTCIIADDDIKYSYYIKFPRVVFHSRSFIYYLDTTENKKDAQPIFYFYPKLHPDYEKRDKNGLVLKLRDPVGEEIEQFWAKFRITVEALVNNLPQKLKSQITGKLSHLKSDFIDKVTAFPIDKYKQPDENQSTTMKLRLWTTSEKPEENAGENKQIINNNEDSGLVVPGTNPKIKIITKIHKLDPKNTKNLSKLIENYEEFKNYVYSSSKNKNASPGGMKTLTFTMDLLSPVLHSGKDGVDLQCTASKICITTVNSASRDKELPSAEQQELIALRKELKEKYGIRDDDSVDDNDESTIDENNNDSPPAIGNKRKRDDNDDEEEYDHINKKQKIE